MAAESADKQGKDTQEGSAPSDEVFVVFTPTGKRGRFAAGVSVLEAARTLGVDLDSVCGGRAICGRCQVDFEPGTFAKFQIVSKPDSLSPTTEAEERYANKRGLSQGRRLGCNARLLADAVIDVPPESQVHRQIIRKEAEPREISVDPTIRLYTVQVREPDMHDPSGDFRRLCESLATAAPSAPAPDAEVAEHFTAEIAVLRGLQKALRDGAWTVTAAVRFGGQAGGPDERRVVALWPGVRERVYGLAVDIGSTTMSGHLCDLATGEVLASAGTMNPQIRFGEDLMSRVSYVMMNPGGDAELTRYVREAVNYLASSTVEEIGATPDEILDLVFVGNPVMHHLMLGIDPSELGFAPFALTVDTAVHVGASDLDLYLHAGAGVYAPPCVAGHVGADAAAVILSEKPYLADEMTLIIDVGTNAEIILGDKHRLLACSSPTGPAFEGAQITCGQRAAPGAIERVRIDPDTLEPRFRVIGSELWSDDPGFAEAISATGVTGICGSGVIEALAEMFLAGILTEDGVINGGGGERIVAEGRTFSWQLSPSVRITQSDVRAIQLAKAALYAGFRLLMDHLEIEVVDRVLLAGAFGGHIEPKYAMILGMVPDCPLDQVRSIGNAAGTGARIALVNRAARREIEQVVRRVEKIETAVEPRFQEHFVEAMAFPHKSAPYPILRQTIRLPDPTTSASDAEAPTEGRRRRRRKR